MSSLSCWCHFEWVVIVSKDLYEKPYTFYHLVEVNIHTHGERDTERNREKIHRKISIFFIHSIPSMPLCLRSILLILLYHSLDAYKLLSFLCCSWNLCVFSIHICICLLFFFLSFLIPFIPFSHFIPVFWNSYAPFWMYIMPKHFCYFRIEKLCWIVQTICLCENHCQQKKKKTTNEREKLPKRQKEWEKQEYKYFRWRMFWIRCKFGKLMMWIKEMQKCDRCELKKKTENPLKETCKRKFTRQLEHYFQCCKCVVCVCSFFFISLLHSIVKKCITFRVAVRDVQYWAEDFHVSTV